MALALTILCACSESDPCEDADCGPGQCVPSSEQAACECPLGYVAADMSCRRDVREGDDHGDYLEAATPVEIMDPSSQWVAGNLDNREDVDLFSFRVTAGRIYRFSCESLHASYAPSCRVELLGADGLKLAGSAGSGGSSTFHASVLATQEGTVYARVQSNASASAYFDPSYKYSLLDRGPDEFANSLTEATPVPVGTVSGKVEPYGDVDVVALDAVAGRAYRLSCSVTTAVNHCGMRVRGPGGEVLYESAMYDVRPTLATFDLQGMQDGRYTVELFFTTGLFFSDGVGDYTFTIADLEP
ncbi:hypothetical protein D7V80_29530 [Corallococcus sp. CA054B]|nr:hypothetical protein D7V80_29530 [Corallococcus sp. CA054B]